MLDALTAVVESAGYSLFVSTARDDDGRYDTLMRRFLERRVDAVFCAHPGGEGALLARYRVAEVPVATLFNRSGGYEALPFLYPTVEGAADAAARRLSSLGHRRVAVILGEAVRGPMIAVRQALKAFGMEIETRRLSEGPLDPAAWLAAWRAAEVRPTAVFAGAGDAVNLLRTARRLGVATPRELSVVAITDSGSRIGRLSQPPAAIQVEGAALGAAAARMMLDWLGGAPPERVQKVSVGSWIERDTIGPAPSDR